MAGRLRETTPADSSTAGQIVLAHENAFTIGPLAVTPATRSIRHIDGREEVLEPRVMQALVALARAGGSTLTREDLTRQCWSGRVVGEDAINRVMSRLRRTADHLGAGVFRIETITKVGYRLTCSAPLRLAPRGEAAPPAGHDGANGAGACAYLMVTCENGSNPAALLPRLKVIPDVGLIHSLAGQADLVVRLDSESIEDIESGRSLIEAMEGVASVHTSVVLVRHVG